MDQDHVYSFHSKWSLCNTALERSRKEYRSIIHSSYNDNVILLIFCLPKIDMVLFLGLYFNKTSHDLIFTAEISAICQKKVRLVRGNILVLLWSCVCLLMFVHLIGLLKTKNWIFVNCHIHVSFSIERSHDIISFLWLRMKLHVSISNWNHSDCVLSLVVFQFSLMNAYSLVE